MENPTETGALGRIPIKPENAILRSTLVARSARNESYFQLNIHTMERVTKLGERGLTYTICPLVQKQFHVRSDKMAGISLPVGCYG